MKNWWYGLEPRQRWVVRGGAMVLVLLGIYHWAVDPIVTEKSRLSQDVSKKTQAAAKMAAWRTEWQSLKSKGGGTATKGSLFATLDRIAGQVGLKNNVAYMKPTSPATRPGQPIIERVDMKLQDITTKDLVAFLMRAETDGGVGIRRIAVVREGKGPYRIQAVAVFETVGPAKPARGAS